MTFSIVPELPGDRDRGEVALPSDILLELLLLEQLTVRIPDGRDSWSKWGGLGCVRLRVHWIFARIKPMWISATTNTIQVHQVNKSLRNNGLKVLLYS